MIPRFVPFREVDRTPWKVMTLEKSLGLETLTSFILANEIVSNGLWGKRFKHKKVPPPQVMYLPFTTLFVSEVSSNEVLPLTEADWPFSNSSSPSTFVFLLSPTSSHLKSPQPLVPLLAIK